MFRKRKVDGSVKLNSTIEKVFQKYGKGDEIGDTAMERDPIIVGRKQKRRDKKLQKKKLKQEHFKFLSKKTVSEPKSVELMEKSKQKTSTTEEPRKKKLKSEIRQKRLIDRDNAADDKVISALEKKLYLNKRKDKKKLPKSFTDAGLDYILNGIGVEVSEEELSNEEKDDFFVPENMSDLQDTNPIDDEDVMKQENSSEKDYSENHNVSNQENERHLMDAVEDDELNNQTSGKYIPPALRVKLSETQEEKMKKLKRKVKGLFNRLSDSNLSSICNDIEILFREESRAFMHKVLTEIIIDQFGSPDPAPESLITETAMLISVISSRIGIESLMHLYEITSTKLSCIILRKDDVDGKAANNLIKLLGCLYQLRRIDCKVILDIFRILISSFTEKDIELILEILNKVGFQLRKDDPESLKDIIKTINTKCDDLNVSLDDGSRMSYMLNVLMAVKNNNIRRVTGFDADAITALRKKLAVLTKTANDSSNSETVPPVKLQDFLDAETNGRWWIVGSSFAGRPMLEQTRNKSLESQQKIQFSVSKNIVDAARKQRMNTDVRRNIFYAVMTADDFVDAFEKILKCGLKGKQLREIPNVVVDCCQQEKSFNPYYLHILNRFCQNDRQFAISLQCTFWDRFKALNSLKLNQMNNIAELLSQLVIMETLTLSCLKAIDFTEIDKLMIQFLRLFLCLLAQNVSSKKHLHVVFEKLRTSTKNKLVRQGLHLFLQYFILSDKQFMSKHSSLQESFHIMLSSVGRSVQTFL